MRDGYTLGPLTRAAVQGHLEELLELDAATLGEPWTEVEWLFDAPEKWQLSRVITHHDGRIGAFVVASRRPNGIHLHRMVVSEGARGNGFATTLVRHLAGLALEGGGTELSLKIHPDNVLARKLFERLGFRAVEQTRNIVMVARCADIPGAG